MSKIEINSEKKELKITIAGLFGSEDAVILVEQLKKEVKSIDLSQYTLILDAKEHKPLNSDEISLQNKIIQFLDLFKVIMS